MPESRYANKLISTMSIGLLLLIPKGSQALNMIKNHTLSISSTVLACILLASCGTPKLVTLLDAVAVLAATTPPAVLVLEGTGIITPAEGNIVLDLAGKVAADTSEAITAAKSGQTTAEITAAIVADYSNLPTVVPGLYPQATAIIQGLLAAVNALLAELHHTPPAIAAKPLILPHSIHLKLEAIRGKCRSAQSAISSAHK